MHEIGQCRQIPERAEARVGELMPSVAPDVVTEDERKHL